MMKKTISMESINSKCAGIDVGSRYHFVAIGQQDIQVRECDFYAEDLELLCKWLISENIDSVAMESTGNYWQNLYRELNKYGIKNYRPNM
jgi:transposase